MSTTQLKGMRPNLKRFTSCRYIRAMRCSASGNPMKGILSFCQYCSNVAGGLGPIASTSAPRSVNFSYSSRRRANCARQYGHIKPRRNARTTGLLFRKSESLILLPFTSSSSKSGASSPGVINLFISDQFFRFLPNLVEHFHCQFSGQGILLARVI